MGTISSYNIKNNVHIIHRLQAIDVTYDFCLISFDVRSLLAFLSEELPEHNFPISADKLMDLVKLCFVEKIFQCSGRFHKQIFGKGMENPLSPVLSNILMEYFETKLEPRVKLPNVHWFRYVDEVSCLWQIVDEVDVFLQNIYKLVHSIQFTTEQEQNYSLPFLDVLIRRQYRTLKFSAYRKPTNICSYVHFYSTHTRATKLSVYSSMFLRRLRICIDEYFAEEVAHIYTIGKKLKYPKKFIERSKT